MEIKDGLIKKIKTILEEKHNKEFSWEEARKITLNVQHFAEVAFNMAGVEIQRRKKLKEFPEGFHLEESQPCAVCGKYISGNQSWYDKNGTKCLHCQRAIDRKVIPVSVLKNKESWYSTVELENNFNITKKVLGKFLKQGILRDRQVLNEKGKVHFQLVLMKDNKDFFPPKKLLKSRTVKVLRKGEEYFTSEFWFEYIDVSLAKKLAKFKIFQYLPELFSQPVCAGRLYYKSINPFFAPDKIWEATIKDHDKLGEGQQ